MVRIKSAREIYCIRIHRTGISFPKKSNAVNHFFFFFYNLGSYMGERLRGTTLKTEQVPNYNITIQSPVTE